MSDFGPIRPRSGGLQRRSRAELSSVDLSPSHRESLSMGEISASADADDILSSMQNSVWGGMSCLIMWALGVLLTLSLDMLVEAAEEDKKL